MGSKVELGIGCESCHGPGSKHVATKSTSDIVNPAKLSAIQQDQVCGQCHSRVTNKQEKELSYPLGFVPGNTDLPQRVNFWTNSSNPKNFWPNDFSSKNRQQYHDVQFSGHTKAGVTCITCHDVHSPRQGYAQLRLDKNEMCIQCHTASSELYKESTMAVAAGVGCVDCHMAKIVSRSDATQKNKNHWEASSHTFDVIMPHEAETLKMKSSCDACHEGSEKTSTGASMVEQQTEIKTKIAEVEKAVAASTHEKQAAEAGNLLKLVTEDRSYGAHNPKKAMALLNEALTIVSKK